MDKRVCQEEHPGYSGGNSQRACVVLDKNGETAGEFASFRLPSCGQTAPGVKVSSGGRRRTKCRRLGAPLPAQVSHLSTSELQGRKGERYSTVVDRGTGRG